MRIAIFKSLSEKEEGAKEPEKELPVKPEETQQYHRKQKKSVH